MQNFEYVAWDQAGTRHEGSKQANTEEDVMAMLRDQDLTPVSITPATAKSNAKKEKKKKVGPYKKVKSQDLATFCWQLNTMLEGGLPITGAIETIASEIENPYLGKVLMAIASQLEKGTPLSECFSEYPKVFNSLSIAMIQAGETSGSMPDTLSRLTEYYENRDKLTRKVKAALAYPIFVVTFIVLIVVALMTFIIPRFTTMFDEMEGELPAFTRGFMVFYDFIVANFIWMGLIGVVAVFAVTFYSKTKSGHYRLCKLGLATPLFGKIKSQAFVAMFCKTLATLMSSGVPMLEAFEILARMTSNDVLKSGIMTTKEKLIEGASVSESMASSNFFPNVAVKMAQIGEQSGALSDVLHKTSEYYEKKVDTLVSTMLGLMEPILIVSVGSIVLVVILAMYLPIFAMGG